MKTHLLLPYKVGLFEHSITSCGAAGEINAADQTLTHYRSGAVFHLSKTPTCKSCLAQQDN